ncbi:unnamed protein product [Paramecium sonneborni]|uniref:PX domain-containing protein n=1 Tax=Paramecium sonneborni TaxID=65129 RepID=A0A8S1KIS7_9CILI|nr:unnamed protein product [Paramecium sonneborni]
MANQTQQQNNNSNQQILNGLDDQLPILSFLKRPKNKNLKQSLNSKQYDQQNCEYQIEVINHKIIDKQFTIYQIKVTYGSLYWIFQTRYSLLEGLHSKLNKEVIKQLAKFPEKRLFGNMDHNFVQKRKNEIHQYLKSLIQYGKNEKPVKDFIKQSQKAAIEINDPCELKHFKLDL